MTRVPAGRDAAASVGSESDTGQRQNSPSHRGQRLGPDGVAGGQHAVNGSDVPVAVPDDCHARCPDPLQLVSRPRSRSSFRIIALVHCSDWKKFASSSLKDRIRGTSHQPEYEISS